MKKILVTTLLTFVLTGCSTTYTVVEPSSRNPYTKSQFNDHILDRVVTIELKNAEQIEAILFRMEEDSIIWIDPNTSYSRELRTKDIKNVVARNHLLGALEGFGIGMFGGFIAGGLLGRAIEGPPRGEFGGLATALAAFSGSIIGTAVGTVFGGFWGHKDEYEFVWFTKKLPPEQRKKKEDESLY